MNQTVVVIDFGAQYSQVIARKIRECNVYCEVISYTTDFEVIKGKNPIGIILSGGPSSVYLDNAPTVDKRIFALGIPILGICYGCQLMVHLLDGKVVPALDISSREYGRTSTRFYNHCLLFNTLPAESITWMSHQDVVEAIPEGFEVCAQTKYCPFAGIFDEKRQFYGLQFHPEVEHTENGKEMLRKFLDNVCHAKGDWSMSNFLKTTIPALKEGIGNEKVLLALSGGVDSSVVAMLLARAIGKQLTCVYIDHGFMRKNESETIASFFKNTSLNFIKVDAKETFLAALKGVTEPEEKRKIIGETFIKVFSNVASKLGDIHILAQGTIYPDVIESGMVNGNKIKSHHNVGGLPSIMSFNKIIEPLRCLFKDEVRKVGLQLSLPEKIIFRQPFPGPGLAVRVIGEITEEKLKILKEADNIVTSTLEESGASEAISQYFAVLTNIKTVGVMGDVRTYYYAIAIRAVITDDFMTANYAKIPYEILEKISTRIVNEVDGVNRVMYDITNKPPSTIEYE